LQPFCDIKDLSYGKENVPIPCVNVLHRDYPDFVEYSNQRIPAEGVSLNLDENFLVGCDCTDGCRVMLSCGPVGCIMFILTVVFTASDIHCSIYSGLTSKDIVPSVL